MKKLLIVISAVATVVLALFIYLSLSYDEMDATRKSAENGDISAQFRMASSYLLGKGVPQSDKEAVKWYKKAADQGDPSGQFFLGKAYYEGTGFFEALAKKNSEAISKHHFHWTDFDYAMNKKCGLEKNVS